MIEKLQLTALLFVVLFILSSVMTKDIEMPQWFMLGVVGGMALSCAASFIITMIMIWA